MNYPEIELAEDDLRVVLAVEPNNLHAAFELLDAMFTFSGMDDKEVAELAEFCTRKAESILLQTISLQIKALGYASEHVDAQAVYDCWIHRFPECELLKSAKEEADSMKVS